MNDHFFMLMYATSGNERNETKFQSFHDVQDAVDVVQDWLQRYCAMDCVPEEQEEAIRAANDGQLPEDVFLCPAVKEPKDLEKYNGFYDMGGLGYLFNVFLTPVYDKASAVKFRGGMIKEFEIDHEFSERADRLLGHLETFVNSFEDPSIDYTEAEAAIRDFLLKGGFDLFDFGCYTNEEEYDIGFSDTFVMPNGGF